MTEINNNILAPITTPCTFHWTSRNMMTTCWDKASVEIYEIPVIGKCSHFTTNLLNREKPTKKPISPKKRVYGNCVVLFLNAQLDINSLQRQPQKVTQETVEITHHLSLALNERCFSRQLPGITRVMQAWSSSKVYLCRWVIRGNKKLIIVIPNSHGWCRNH